MIVKVFETNNNGKIEFTNKELEKLLNEVYSAGVRDGEEKAHKYTWTSPYYGGTTLLNNLRSTNEATLSSDNATINKEMVNALSGKSENPKTFSVKIEGKDAENISKYINDLFGSGSAFKKPNSQHRDAFTDLAKELNF